MFVSETRKAIAALIDQGLNLNEIAHRLGLANSTVGYHARALRAVNRGVITPRPRRLPLEQLLVAGPRRNRNHLKRRLFAAGLKSRRCESCGLDSWMGRAIPLALHHVNGDRHDNRLENLQILCPNCHGLTDTWAGRNIPRIRLREKGAPGT